MVIESHGCIENVQRYEMDGALPVGDRVPGSCRLVRRLVNARQQQAEGNRELERRLEQGSTAWEGSLAERRSSSPRARLAEGSLVGRIEIPRLHVSTIVFEGTGDNVLSIGVGHLTGTALPGDQGNVVLAAHRDTFFRPLRSVHKCDRIDVVTPARNTPLPGGFDRRSCRQTI